VLRYLLSSLYGFAGFYAWPTSCLCGLHDARAFALTECPVGVTHRFRGGVAL